MPTLLNLPSYYTESQNWRSVLVVLMYCFLNL